MGQYVKRSGKTYYKGDDGKLYKDYSAALAAANKPQTGFEYGLSLLGVRPDRSQQSGLEYGMKQLAGLAGIPGQPETGLQYGLQQAGNLFNKLARGANAQELDAIEADQSLLGRVMPLGSKAEPFVVLEKPTTIPAGTVQPTAIVKGLTPAGAVDRTQGDEYKAQMAQYQNLINQKKQEEAEDLGMKIWMEKYGKSGLGLTGPNPLMKEFENAPSGFGTFTADQGPTPVVLQASEAPLKAFGQEVKTYFPGAGPEGFSPLDAQDQQQQATADQADMATTVKLPIRNRVQAFLQGGM